MGAERENGISWSRGLDEELAPLPAVEANLSDMGFLKLSANEVYKDDPSD